MALGRVAIPTVSNFEQTAKILNDLIKNMPAATEEIKKVRELQNGLTDVSKRVRETKKVASESNRLAKQAQGEINKLRNLGKQVQESKKVTDALQKGQWSKVGGAFAKFMSLALIALTIFNVILGVANTWAIGEINESNIKQFERAGREFAAQFRLIERAYNRIKLLEIDLKKLKDDIDATKRTLYTDVQNLLNQVPKIRLNANNALYEAKKGRAILEGRLNSLSKRVNDALYETRVGRIKLEDLIKGARKVGNDALYEARVGIQRLNNQFNSINPKLFEINARVSRIDENITNTNKRINNLEIRINNSSSNASNNELVRRAEIPNLIKKETPAIASSIEPHTTRLINGRLDNFQRGIDTKINQKVDRSNLVSELQQRASDIGRILLPTINNAISPVVTKVDRLELAVPALTGTIGNLARNFGDLTGVTNNLSRRIDKETAENNRQSTEIESLKNRLKEQEKVNQEGNKKLDQLIGWSLSIPPILALIPAKSGQQAANNILPQIPNLAATGFCQTLQPGGCSRRAFDDLGTNVNNSINAANNSLWDKINAGLNGLNTAANSAILSVVNEVNTKLGPLLPNGISTFLTDFLARFNRVAEWLHLDRILNVLIWWQTLHNAAMLSNNIVLTLTAGINNVLAFIGIKDAEGQTLDIGAVVGKAYTDMLISALGEEAYNNLNKAWNAANRIYQSVANLANLVQSMQQSILTALEYLGAAQGKLANALKAAGKVFENAYEWMNVQPNFDNPLFTKLAKFQEAASTIEQITQVPVDIKRNIESLRDEKNQMKEALKDGENALKGLGIIESENEKKKVADSKRVSSGKDLDDTDKIEDEQ